MRGLGSITSGITAQQEPSQSGADKPEGTLEASDSMSSPPASRSDRQRAYGAALAVLDQTNPALAGVIRAHVADLRRECARGRVALRDQNGDADE